MGRAHVRVWYILRPHILLSLGGGQPPGVGAGADQLRVYIRWVYARLYGHIVTKTCCRVRPADEDGLSRVFRGMSLFLSARKPGYVDCMRFQ